MKKVFAPGWYRHVPITIAFLLAVVVWGRYMGTGYSAVQDVPHEDQLRSIVPFDPLVVALAVATLVAALCHKFDHR